MFLLKRYTELFDDIMYFNFAYDWSFSKNCQDTWKSSNFSEHTNDVASEKQDRWASPIKRQMFHVNTMIYNSGKMNVFVQFDINWLNPKGFGQKIFTYHVITAM